MAVVWLTISLVFLGTMGFELMAANYRIAWLSLVLLSIAGLYVTITQAIALGVFSLFTASAFLLWQVSDQPIAGPVLLAMLGSSVAPIWTAAAATRMREHRHIEKMLQIPEVRATLQLSPETILPTTAMMIQLFPRIAAGWDLDKSRGIIVEARFIQADVAKKVLGSLVWQGKIQQLADLCRAHMRPFDWIFVDTVHDDRVFLVFEERIEDDIDAIVKELEVALSAADLPPVRIVQACYPEHGDTLPILTRALDKQH